MSFVQGKLIKAVDWITFFAELVQDTVDQMYFLSKGKRMEKARKIDQMPFLFKGKMLVSKMDCPVFKGKSYCRKKKAFHRKYAKFMTRGL